MMTLPLFALTFFFVVAAARCEETSSFMFYVVNVLTLNQNFLCPLQIIRAGKRGVLNQTRLTTSLLSVEQILPT